MQLRDDRTTSFPVVVGVRALRQSASISRHRYHKIIIVFLSFFLILCCRSNSDNNGPKVIIAMAVRSKSRFNFFVCTSSQSRRNGGGGNACRSTRAMFGVYFYPLKIFMIKYYESQTLRLLRTVELSTVRFSTTEHVNSR